MSTRKGSNKMGEAFVIFVQGDVEDEDDGLDIEEAEQISQSKLPWHALWVTVPCCMLTL